MLRSVKYTNWVLRQEIWAGNTNLEVFRIWMVIDAVEGTWPGRKRRVRREERPERVLWTLTCMVSHKRGLENNLGGARG